MAATTVGDTEDVEKGDEETLTAGKPGIGLNFGKQGFSRMCDYVPFSELKLFRLVCQTWNEIITMHKRFHNGHLKIGIGWESNCNCFDLNSMSKWKIVTLNRFALHLIQNHVFTKYWTDTAERVKVLNLEYIKVSCQDLAKVINDCSSVESITLVGISFTPIKFRPAQEIRDENNFNMRQDPYNRNIIPRTSVCCQHDFFIPTGTIRPSTIKSILISKQVTFPFCILDLLALRSQGILETFIFESNNQNIQLRGDALPNMIEIENDLLQIFQGSNQTLKNFVWIKSGDNEIITHLLDQENFQPALDKLIISEKPFENQDHWDFFYRDTLRVPIINFLQRQLGLIEINISLVSLTPQFRQEIENILPNMPLLQKIKFKIDLFTQNMDINMFQEAVSLNELEIIIIKCTNPDRFQWGGEVPQLNSNYLGNLPFTIRKLTCDHELNRDILATSLLHPSFFLLSKLKIIKGNVVDDLIAQMIIVHLSNLQELAIHNSLNLTDAGLTGLDPLGCARLIRCHAQTLLLQEPTDTNVVRRRVLNELIYLRELDFTGCKRLSDISVCYAIRFPELKKLTLSRCYNVSDIGLISLSIHNPKLETFIITCNRRISHFGLNRLIQNCKTLHSVQTTNIMANRLSTSGVIEYTQSHYFKDIVSFIPTELHKKHD